MTDAPSLDADVALTVDTAVATLTLRRPSKLNAITPEMLDALGGHINTIETSNVRVVVVRGEGSRAFCVGADIDRFASLSPVQMLSWTAHGHRVFDALAALRQPTVAVVHALAFGGGLELALACDFRIVSLDTRLGLPEVGLGTVPGWGGTERLAELIGRSRAKEIVLAQRILDGVTAEAWGLATVCAPSSGIEPAVADLVDRLASGGPVAIALAKQIIDAADDGAPSRVLEALAGAVTSTTQDLKVGIEAHRSKATPLFTGR
jgi:enoyl-CoA hydratase